jgi:beta-lactamase class A
MTRRLLLWLLALTAFSGLVRPAAAQEASPDLRAAAERVVTWLKGEAPAETVFTQAFLQAVPAAQLQAAREQLAGQHGAPLRLAAVEPRSPLSGMIAIEMERATVRMDMAIEARPPHRITGLLVTGAETRGDTPAALGEALAALPGQTSFAIARLGDGPPELIVSRDPDRAMAIGSTFKLFILAALSRQVQAGERRWSDVVTLDRRSMPSGMLQNWPAGSPVTLHTLASLMISISDNSATDMLLSVVGRENVERMMATIGVEAAARNRPFPSTLEMFALKTAPDADQQAWVAANEAERRRLLETRYGRADAEALDPAIFAGRPLRIGELEWFASAADLVRTMDWLRRNGDDTARAILAISPGGPRTLRRDYAYIGYKGGSEPGVVSQTWLVQNRAGAWHVVTVSWNNPDAALDETRFFGLTSRALQLIR